MNICQMSCLVIVCIAANACAECTPEEKEQIRNGIVHLAIVSKARTDCNFTTQIDTAPVVFYSRSCFHEGGPPSSEQCAYAIAVLREEEKMCEVLYIEESGNLQVRTVHDVLRVQGNVEVLVVGVDRSSTSLASDFPTEWVEAQSRVNQNHYDYATSIGLSDPIVQFVSTNVVVTAQDLESGGTGIYLDESAMRAKLDQLFSLPPLSQQNLLTSNFDVLLVMGMDPNNPTPYAGAGGWSSGRRIVIWWFSAPSPGNVDITPLLWWTFANAAYGHEVDHLAGWPGAHYWPAYSGAIEGMWVAPETMGWTDSNRNGSVDLLDPNPYDI